MSEQDIKHGRVDDILAERGGRYGDFSANAEVAQHVKNSIFNYATSKMTPYMRESLELIATKISRIATGDPFYADNWDDIAGYAKLVADRVRAKKALDQFEPVPDDPARNENHGLRSPNKIDVANDGEWHPSHRISTLQDLGGDVYTKCIACGARELTDAAQQLCVPE